MIRFQTVRWRTENMKWKTYCIIFKNVMYRLLDYICVLTFKAASCTWEYEMACFWTKLLKSSQVWKFVRFIISSKSSTRICNLPRLGSSEFLYVGNYERKEFSGYWATWRKLQIIFIYYLRRATSQCNWMTAISINSFHWY